MIELIDFAQTLYGFIDHHHARSHPDGELSRIHSCNSRAYHHDVRRFYSRHSGEKNAASFLGLLQVVRCDLYGKTPSYFGHWGKQWEAAGRITYCLIRDGSRSRGEEHLSLRGVWGKVQVGEYDLPRTEHGAFRGLRLFYLND